MMSVYIHIPFCNSICSYCDFCKFYKNDVWIEKYLDALEKEIQKYYNNEMVKTLYFGGGTPSALNLRQLEKLFSITNIFNLTSDCEITFECNGEDLSLEKLKFLSKKVNRLSIGVQTFNDKFIKVLGRKPIDIDKIKLAKKYFDNINIDLMYGFKWQTLNDLRDDIDMFLNLDVPHLSAYNLILEEHTKLYIDNYEVNEDIEFDKLLDERLRERGYKHYEVSNYAKEGFESKHNLTYWNNEEYYGFGLGASGYIDDVRYNNAKNLNKYFNGTYRLKEHRLGLNETLQNEFILGFRKLDGINKNKFKNKYEFDVKKIKIVNELLENKMLLESEDNIYINPIYLHLSNEILVKFLEKLY